jgi:hypothetical protein
MLLTFQETLHKHKQDDKEEQEARYSNVRLTSFEESFEQDSSSTKGKILLKNWPLMSSIIHYCIISFDDSAYSEVFSNNLFIFCTVITILVNNCIQATTKKITRTYI